MLQSLTSRLQSYRLEAGIALALIALLSFTAWLFMPGIAGPFVLDDFGNLSALGEYGGVVNFDTFRQFVFGNNSGPTGRPVSMLSFLIDARNWPAHPAPFKYTNIMIHLLCGTSLCWLAFLLSERLGLQRKACVQIAVIVMMLWLVHPLNVSTALYVVQRMAQLMTLFATLALVFYMLGRRAMEHHDFKANLYLLLSLIPFGLLSVLSKENGALLLLLIVIIESLFFRNHVRTRLFTLWYRTAVVFPLFIVFSFLVYSIPGFLESYEFRHFSMTERLLSETRILSTYIWKIFLPDQQLGSVFHDAYNFSTGVFSPPATALSILFLLFLFGMAVFWRHKQPVFSFSVFWFFTLHLIESTFLPLELYFEHRNYMAMFGPLFAIAWYVRKLLSSTIDMKAKSVAVVFVVGNFILSSWLTYSVIQIWSTQERFYQHMAEQQPRSLRARLVYSEYLESIGQYQEALEQLYILREYHPNEVVVLLRLWNFACLYRLEQPMSLLQISKQPDLRLSMGSVSFQLEALENNLRAGYCTMPPHEELIALYQRVTEFTMRPGRSARARFNFSNLYLLFNQPDQALEKLDEAYAFQPSISIRLRQAVVAGIAGNYELGLEFTKMARELDASRSRLLPSREAQIVRIESALLAQLDD
jgi:tetratricopeptide (TPR) repeat protein